MDGEVDGTMQPGFAWETGNKSTLWIWGRRGRGSIVPCEQPQLRGWLSSKPCPPLAGTEAETGKKNEHLEVHMNKLMPQGCQSCANTLS